MNKSKIDKKIKKVALEYIVAHTQFALWDCSDAMREIDKLEAVWEVLTDGKTTLKEYIKKNLYKEYKDQVEDIAMENGESLEEVLQSYGHDLLLPYK